VKDSKLLLTWHADAIKPITIILASGYPLTTAPETNLSNCSSEDALGFTVIHCTPKDPGNCKIWLKPPDWALPLPSYAEAPRYSD
jgi:hypothetical protein